MANRYEYEIDERAREVAIKELNEDPSQVNAHIESLRRWVKSMPHLQCPMDAKFLLQFLRTSKFSHAKAQKRLDNFCTVRASERGFQNYLRFFAPDHPLVDTFLNGRFVTPLGKIDSGEIVVLFTNRDWDPEIFPVNDLVPLMFMAMEIILLEEECQIFGVRFLFDFCGVNKKVIEALLDPQIFKAGYTILQDSYPTRLKGQIFYSDSTLFDLAFQMISFFLNDKMKKRTSRISHNISKCKGILPGLEKILPKEYNGLGEPLDEYVEKFSEKFRQYYKNGHPLQSIRVDESKRPRETLSFLVSHEEFEGKLLKKEGTYTKFEDVF